MRPKRFLLPFAPKHFLFLELSYSYEMFGKTFETNNTDQENSVVIMRDISVFSYCEHHMALMYDMHVNVAYIPHERVLGLSKIARICDMAAKRLQLQERLGHDIAEIISEAAGSPDVGVQISGSHSCMTARGIKNVSAQTVTKTFLGEKPVSERNICRYRFSVSMS